MAGRTAARRRLPLAAAIWLAMMAVWLAALGFGLWWAWPHFERLELSGDLVSAVVWLVIGAAAWIVALRLGIQRYFRR